MAVISTVFTETGHNVSYAPSADCMDVGSADRNNSQ